MSFRQMLDRTVTITPRLEGDELDDRGNRTITDGEPFEARAMRELVDTGEDDDRRDQQSRTYRYLIAAHDPETGIPIPITGYDELVDEGETWSIDGSPEYVRRRNRGRIHHVELRASRVGPTVAGVLP